MADCTPTGLEPADSTLPPHKRTRLGLYMTPAQAHQHMQEAGPRTLFVDIRSRAEVAFLGMPTVADANIPYMELAEFYPWDEKRATYKRWKSTATSPTKSASASRRRG